MKRLLGLAAIVAVFAMMVAGCSSSSGLADPSGPHSKEASEIELIPNTLVAHTNGNVYLTAHVYDANGQPIDGEDVTFKIITGVGTLKETTRRTDDRGYCQTSVASAQDGFTLVEASTTNDTGVFVRDAEFIRFEHRDGQAPGGTFIVKPAAILLSVDSDQDGVFGEPGDFTIREAGNEAVLRAQFVNNNDDPIPNATIQFYSDVYTYHQIVFPEGSTRTTDENGYAFVKVQSSIAMTEHRSFVEFVAYEPLTKATNTIQLGTIAVGTLSVSAFPNTIETDGNTTVNAFVFDEQGNTAQDGTAVFFSTDIGAFDITTGIATTTIAETSGGVASVTFVGGQVGTATVTGTAGGKRDTASIEIVATIGTPSVVPESQNILPSSSATYAILGGQGPFTVYVDQPDLVTVSVNGRMFTVTNSYLVGDQGEVAITVVDATGQTAGAALTIGSIEYQIDPADAVISAGNSQIFWVFGGQPPYDIFSNHCECVNFCGTGGFSPSPGTGGNCTTTVAASGGSFIVCTNPDISCDDEEVTLTSVDIVGAPITTSITLGEPSDLQVSGTAFTFNNGTVATSCSPPPPNEEWVVDARYFINGGLAPYRVDFAILQSVGPLAGPQDPVDHVVGILPPTGIQAVLPAAVGIAGTNSAEFEVRFRVPSADCITWEMLMMVWDSNDNLTTMSITMN